MEHADRTAYVFVRHRLAGTLYETESGYAFVYDADYLQDPGASPVSLTLPKQNIPFTSKTLFPFFDGLIPEGWLLDIVSHNWKIDPADRFGLLMIACRDSIGNVSVKGSLA